MVVPALPVAKVEWKYGIQDIGLEDVKLCPKTFRPFYYIGQKTWAEVAV